MQAAECLSKDFLNKLYMPKQMGKDQLYDLELEGPIALGILDRIAWNFACSPNRNNGCGQRS